MAQKIDFNDHIDDMMQRLMSEDLTEQQLQIEISRSKALCSIVDRKIEHNKTVISAMALVARGDVKLDVVESKLLQ
jgi:hypothetical protein